MLYINLHLLYRIETLEHILFLSSPSAMPMSFQHALKQKGRYIIVARSKPHHRNISASNHTLRTTII